ncbi:MAG: hypothetical protein OXE86_09645 [Alphaproteobacteria bacterium]|nr:hypothetical protein [Alphaproteobacteria bacterium]
MQVTIALQILAVSCACVAPGITTGVEGRSDTTVIPRELHGYPKAFGMRHERGDTLTDNDVCRAPRAGGRGAMAVVTKARDASDRFAGRPNQGLGAWIPVGPGGTAVLGQFGERYRPSGLIDVC